MEDLLVLLNHNDKYWVTDDIVQKCMNIWARFCPNPVAVLGVFADSSYEEDKDFFPIPQIWGASIWCPSIPIVTVRHINDNHYVSIKIIVSKKRIVYVDPYGINKSDSPSKTLNKLKRIYYIFLL